MPVPITATLAIDERDLSCQYHRAGGPGGQHVNKVATAVQLRFVVAGHSSLPPGVQARARSLAGRRLTELDEILIEASRHRSRERNREEALERLVELLRRAATPPAKRIPTRIPRGSKQRRLEEKQGRARIKRLRGRPEGGD